MPKVSITGVDRNVDGEYEFDMVFTHRDFRTIKQMSGVRANEIQDALKAGDLDLMVAFAAIALRRAGKEVSEDQLWDVEGGNIVLDASDLEDEEGNSATPPESGDASRPASARSASGAPSRSSTEPSPETSPPNGSGTPEQASISDQATLTS